MNNANGDSSNMNVRRFVAENSRAALRQVRDTLGGDAIILANRSIDGGVEVLAAAPEAVDALTRRMTATTPDSLPLALPTPAPPTTPATPTELGLKSTPQTIGRRRLASLFGRRTPAQPDAMPIPSEPAVPASVAAKAASSYLSFADELTAATDDGDAVVSHLALAAPSQPVAMPIADALDAKSDVVPTSEPMISAAALSDAVAREVRNELGRELGRDVLNDLTHDVSREVSLAVSGEVTREVTSSVTRGVGEQVTREIRAMQALLTEQLSTLTWTDAMRRQPARTKLMQDLILAGFSPALARHIQSRLPEGHAPGQAIAWARSVLKRNLPVARDAEELIAEGGVYALVGPTGVGKTTTVAKLAARFAMKHGVDQLALITTDGFRIGAQDQLRIYGKILGIAVHSIHDEATLKSAITQLANRKLVLIDTAGLSPRDERVAEQIAMLRGAKAKRLVVLDATSDAETLDRVVATFADREFAGCVITKTDEAVRTGPVLDAVIRHRLRIHHVSTGQKVPEDLERPDAAALIDVAFHDGTPNPAFGIDRDDEPVWMSAVAMRATALDPSLLDLVPINPVGTEPVHA